MRTRLLLTCEHGGAQIPARYQKLFRGKSSVLKTHRALDIGALPIAKDLNKSLAAPLDYVTVSRLLIDMNRSLNSETLFSEFTETLPSAEKQRILNHHYFPHRNKFEKRVQTAITNKNRVLHIAVHSFSRVLKGVTRPMEIAVLYDPARRSEKKFADLWIADLKTKFPEFKIARNNPYKGVWDGLPRPFRKTYSDRQYIGIELELNQSLIGNFKNASERKKFSSLLAASITNAKNKLEV